MHLLAFLVLQGSTLSDSLGKGTHKHKVREEAAGRVEKRKRSLRFGNTKKEKKREGERKREEISAKRQVTHWRIRQERKQAKDRRREG